MRKIFAELLHQEMQKNKNIHLITGDVGYILWDKIKEDYPDRYTNPGSAEMLMVGMSVGMAMENKIPVAYSITPFLLYRPFEIIRNYANHEGIPIKLVGGGRDRDYGAAGYTHWCEDDVAVMKALPNVISFRPENTDELRNCFFEFLYNSKPCYMNLRK